MQQTGPTEIQRDKQSIPSAINLGVQMNDAVVTANAKVSITFKDDSKVEITEQSKLLIDDFVFDGKKTDAGKMGFKVAMGTARFASGQIAKHSPENIAIETPTATVGVRGTDFTLTVDELGRSLVVLLPSCPTNYKNIEKDCYVGSVEVMSDAGVVLLNRAFQATFVKSREQNPTKPVIIKLTQAEIDNLLILTPPKEIPRDQNSNSTSKTALDINFLDQDFLKFDGLDVNFLTQTSSTLGINWLDQEFLFNLLDLLNSQLLQNMLNPENGMLPNYAPNKAAGLMYIVDDNNNLVLYRQSTSSYVQISVDKDSNKQVNITQDGVALKQSVNKGGGTTINVTQSR